MGLGASYTQPRKVREYGNACDHLGCNPFILFTDCHCQIHWCIMSYYFFKVTPSMVLDDPEIGLLDTWVRDLYWKCYAVASEAGGNDGLLLSLPKLAFRVRALDKTLTDALEAMRKVGLAEESADGWRLTRFKKEQERHTTTERVRDYRKRKRNANETERYTDIDIELEQELKPDDVVAAEIKTRTAELSRLYFENIGAQPTGLTADLIRNAAIDYPGDWYRPAFEIAVKANVRKWAYVEAILKYWQEHGFGTKPERKTQPRSNQPAAFDAVQAWVSHQGESNGK